MMGVLMHVRTVNEEMVVPNPCSRIAPSTLLPPVHGRARRGEGISSQPPTTGGVAMLDAMLCAADRRSTVCAAPRCADWYLACKWLSEAVHQPSICPHLRQSNSVLHSRAGYFLAGHAHRVSPADCSTPHSSTFIIPVPLRPATAPHALTALKLRGTPRQRSAPRLRAVTAVRNAKAHRQHA